MTLGNINFHDLPLLAAEDARMDHLLGFDSKRGWCRVPMASIGQIVILNSGSGMGSANSAQLQNAVNQGGLVNIVVAGTYELGRTIYLPSNTLVRLGLGVELKMAAGNFRPMFVNSNYSNLVGASVTITSSGVTATVTWNSHGLVVGDMVAIGGAVETSYLGVHRVATVTDANTFTYTMHEAASATPATGTIRAWKADVNIGIEGGTLNYNEAAGAGTDTPNKMCVIFVHVHRAAVTNTRIINVEKYAIYPVNVRDLVVRDVSFDTASDGVHLGGVDGAHIENIYGYCGDDLLAMMPHEGSLNYNLGAWHSVTGFPHRAIVARNLRGAACLQSGVKITGSVQPFFEIDIEGIYGEFGNSLVTCFEDVAFALGAPSVRFMRVANVDASFQDTLGSIRFGCAAGSGTIDQLLVENVRSEISGTRKVLDVRSSGAGVYTIRQLTWRNALMNCGTISGTAGGLHVGTNGVIDNLDASGLRSAGTANATFAMFLVDGTVSRARVSAFETLSGNGFFFRVNATAGACDLFLNDGLTRNTNNPVQFFRAANLYAKGWKHSGSTCVNINGTGTYILRGGVDSANTHIAIAGGASVQVYGFDFRGDPIALGLATTVGQYMHSTQAGAEEGPAVRVAGGWYALAAGASGANGAIT